MSQPQKRKYVRRKKTVLEPALPTPELPIPPPPQIANHHSYSDITSIQDEEYEMSIMMDIIKMQEREEKEKLEKEREKQLREAQELEEKMRIRDHNIKEILRKLKFGNCTSQLETNIIELLENAMETQCMYIYVHDMVLYNNICCYLGIGDENKKGTIRLPESVKDYAKNMFLHV
jgi:hypothetical protein